MSRLIVAAFAISMISAPSLAQGMRDAYDDYSSQARCFKEQGGSRIDYCVYANDNVHNCYWQQNNCEEAALFGKLNQRFRSDFVSPATLREFYIEGGNLILYSCLEGVLYSNKCGGKPDREVYYPL